MHTIKEIQIIVKSVQKKLIDEIVKDLEEYQFSIGCTWCDCEKKMWKLQEKWEEKLK